jgi:hypothetical protein
VHHLIDPARDPDVVRDVMPNEAEPIATEQVLDVADASRAQIVEADDLITPFKE